MRSLYLHTFSTFELGPAVKFGLFYALILLISKAAQTYLGDSDAPIVAYQNQKMVRKLENRIVLNRKNGYYFVRTVSGSILCWFITISIAQKFYMNVEVSLLELSSPLVRAVSDSIVPSFRACGALGVFGPCELAPPRSQIIKRVTLTL